MSAPTPFTWSSLYLALEKYPTKAYGEEAAKDDVRVLLLRQMIEGGHLPILDESELHTAALKILQIPEPFAYKLVSILNDSATPNGNEVFKAFISTITRAPDEPLKLSKKVTYNRSEILPPSIGDVLRKLQKTIGHPISFGRKPKKQGNKPVSVKKKLENQQAPTESDKIKMKKKQKTAAVRRLNVGKKSTEVSTQALELTVTPTSVGCVDFTKQLDNFRFQDPDAKELMYAPGIVNFAKIYKELQVNGVDSALKMVRSIEVDQVYPAQLRATQTSHAKQSR